MATPVLEYFDPSEGYAPRWTDTEDFIEDITYRIWEKGNVDFIRDTYSDTCPIFTLSGNCEGVEIVVQNTSKTLKSFPDRSLYPADVVWNGNNTTGYHSSHLISTKMTYHHTEEEKEGEFSAASHLKQARIWVIAHCVMKDGVIVREWLVRDNKSLYEQLGVCSEEVAKRWAEKWRQEKLNPDKSGSCHLSWLAEEFQRVQKEGTLEGNISINLHNIRPAVRPIYQYIGQRVAELYRKVWGPEGMESRDRFQELIGKVYHPHARFESPQTINDTDLTGWRELTTLYDTFILGKGQGQQVAMSLDWVIVKPGHDKRKILSNGAVPNAWRYPEPTDVNLQLELEREFKNSEQVSESFTMAIRWTLVGNRKQDLSDVLVPVVLLAESHLNCVGFRVIRDITVYDKVALEAQI